MFKYSVELLNRTRLESLGD